MSLVNVLCTFMVVFNTLMGIVIGSFLNVVIYRTPMGKTIVKGHSMCMTCSHTLGALDLVPIFSWIFLKGKCRYCGAPIASRYCKIESLTGLVFLITTLTHMDSTYFAFLGNFQSFCLFAYNALFLLSSCFVISAMMIWYDTNRGFMRTAVIPTVCSFISIVLIYINNQMGASDYILFVLKFIARIALLPLVCFIICLISKKKYSRNDLFLDLTFASMLTFALYTGFTNPWIEVLCFAIILGIIRACMQNKKSERYLGIIGASMVVICCIINSIMNILN